MELLFWKVLKMVLNGCKFRSPNDAFFYTGFFGKVEYN